MCADLGDYRPAGTAVVGDTAQCTLTQRSKWTDTCIIICPLRWFRVSSVSRVDVAEDDRTVRKSVPESTAAGAIIRTDVCGGRL